MMTYHSSLNLLIDELEAAHAKGQPEWVKCKANKERNFRQVIRAMREAQQQPPRFADVWLYFKTWLRWKVLPSSRV